MENSRKRFFNTTGPCRPDIHYMLPTEERLVGAQLHRYIRAAPDRAMSAICNAVRKHAAEYKLPVPKAGTDDQYAKRYAGALGPTHGSQAARCPF
jgi:hypothetical protein